MVFGITMWLIGSRASPHLMALRTEAPDWDLFLTEKEWADIFPERFRFLKITNSHKAVAVTQEGERLELHRMADDHSFNLLDILPHRLENTPLGEAITPEDSILKLIKKAHLYWNVRWLKHIADFHQLTSGEATKVTKKFYKLRSEEMMARWGGKFEQHLNKTTEDFFGQSAAHIKRKIWHDQLHELVANGRPFFKDFLVEGQEVLLDNEKIKLAGDDACMRLIQEEVSTLTLERYCLPNNTFEPNRCQQEYQLVYAHFSTRMTSGWFREQAINFWQQCGQNILLGALERTQEAVSLR